MSYTWMTRGACTDLDPNIFIPLSGSEYAEERAPVIEQAKRICATCPVQQECLDYALKHPTMPGVFGGMTRRERKRYQARMGRTTTP